jgi:hypothetical protein
MNGSIKTGRRLRWFEVFSPFHWCFRWFSSHPKESHDDDT